MSTAMVSTEKPSPFTLWTGRKHQEEKYSHEFAHKHFVMAVRKRNKGTGKRTHADRERWTTFTLEHLKRPYEGERGAWTTSFLLILGALHHNERENWAAVMNADSMGEGADYAMISTSQDGILDDVWKISQATGLDRANVCATLNKMERHGMVERTGKNGRRVTWGITEYGIGALWTGITKRIGRKSQFGGNPRYWNRMTDALVEFEYDALTIVRDIIHVRNILKAGTADPQMIIKTHRRRGRDGEMTTFRRRTVAIARGEIRDWDGNLKYCWNSSVIWGALRGNSLTFMLQFLRQVENKYLDGKIKSFFAYTFGTLRPKPETIAKAHCYRKKRYSRGWREYRREKAAIEYLEKRGKHDEVADLRVMMLGKTAVERANMAVQYVHGERNVHLVV